MRIIRGTHGGRRVNPPAGLPVRPTTDLAKESLFNILENHFYFEDLEVLDLFAGTGNISFEFASRGCREVISVDVNQRCMQFISKTASELGLNNIRTVRASIASFLRMSKKSFDIAFADPPYEMENLDGMVEEVLRRKLIRPNGAFILEHDKSWDFSSTEGFDQLRRYGKVHFSFFRLPETK